MGSGRRPDPTRMKLLRGTFRADRGNPQEPKPIGKARCPRWLPRLAREEWKRVAPLLEAQGVLTDWDQTAFAGYCTAVADLREAEKIIKREGYVGTSVQGGQTRHPAVIVKNQALELIKKLAAEFGLTPSSRTKIRARKAGELSPGAKGFDFRDGA